MPVKPANLIVEEILNAAQRMKRQRDAIQALRESAQFPEAETSSRPITITPSNPITQR